MEAMLPGFDSWMLEAKQVMISCPKWDGCDIREIIYDVQGGFSAQSVSDKVLSALGPVVLIPNVQTKASVELAHKIGRRTVIRTAAVGDSTTLWQLLEDAHDAFAAGEPQRPRSIVVALLLIRKLEKDHMWGGKNKGYMWAGDLPSGRGVPANCAGPIPNILSQLFSNNILIRKVSQGKNKYALIRITLDSRARRCPRKRS
jgi:hypothetical protein